MNLLVGPNNAGKSTILNAFRVIAAGIRRANARRAEVIEGPERETWGHVIQTDDIPMSFENVHNNYDTSRPATVTFNLSNRNKLIIYFGTDGQCVMIPEAQTGSIHTPTAFRKHFSVTVDFVPVLGPLEHEEQRVERATVQRNLPTHRASRNFRNYWRYYPDDFEQFAELLRNTWPGMEIGRPEILSLNTVSMFVQEDRIPRELFWAGFGFQIWCQLLTHIVRARSADILVVDEPEIYLHPDLQRQLLSVLRTAGPDVVLATHSTEMLAEADPQEIVLIDKTRRSGKRLRDIDQVQNAVEILGSSQNITLTQLARTRRVLFVEGKDFKILSRFARILGYDRVANQSDFTVVPTDGFSQWPKLQALEWGFQRTLGESLVLGAVFDRDFRCEEEIQHIRTELARSLKLIHFHRRKELENYLLLPEVLDRAIRKKAREKAKRQDWAIPDIPAASEILLQTTELLRADNQAQYIDNRNRFFASSSKHSATITKEAIGIFDANWSNINTRLEIVHGKDALAGLKYRLQEHYGIGLSDMAILSECRREDIPHDMARFLRQVNNTFSKAIAGS